MVEATRHHAAIYQNADLVAQGITEKLRVGQGFSVAIGPLKNAVVFQVDVFAKFPSVVTFGPRLGQLLRQ